MKFCQPHWDALRQAIEDRGLTALVAEGGESAAKNLVSEIEDGPTLDNFDPLMAAHNSILANAMEIATQRYHANSLAMLTGDPEHPEWECPICFLNFLHADHDANCTQPGCEWPKGQTYEWMISRGADDSAEQWRDLRP